ncbi:MAG: LamG-like jellyroll fold domain-containing protein [Candidatus Nanoarchaeia archaeon]
MLIYKIINQFNSNKRGYVFTIMVIIGSILMYSYLQSQLYESVFVTEAEQNDLRINQLSREFTYLKNSVAPQALRFSIYHATQEYTNIIYDEETGLHRSYNYSHIQDSIYELALNGTYNSNPRSYMENKTLPYILDEYINIINSTYRANLSYKVINGRIFEDTPLALSAQSDIELRLRDESIGVRLSDTILANVNINLEGIRDPQIVLHVPDGNSTAEVLERARATNVSTDWDDILFDETYQKGLVTVFTYPEYEYTIGTSFLRSITNSAPRGLYRDILSFLSFQYERDESPKDTKNYKSTHQLFSNTIFLHSFENVSSGVDETNYNYVFNTNTGSGDNCTITGVSGRGCELGEGLREIQNLELEGDNFAISFWVNPTLNDQIFQSSEFNISIDSSAESIILEGVDDSSNSFQLQSSIELNDWSNVVVQSRNNGFEMLIDAQRRSSLVLPINVSSVSSLEFGNAQFDEIVIINRSISTQEIAQLRQAREAIFLEYKESLYDRAIELNDVRDINLSLNHQLNKTFDQFAVEMWVQLEESSGGEILRLENSTSSQNLILELYKNSLNFSIDGSYSFNPSTSNLMNNRYKHILLQLNESDEWELYINNKFIDSSSFSGTIGNYDTSILLAGDDEFSGLLDEFVLYNTSFSQEEIEEHYFNFKSSVGGCCNYFKMYNEDTHSPPSIGSLNVSTSTLFLHNWSNYDLFVAELERRNTSYPATYDWYGTTVDACQPFVYNLDGYSQRTSFRGTSSTNTCVKLIEKGIY